MTVFCTGLLWMWLRIRWNGLREASGTVVIPFPAEAAVELEVRMILPAERMQDQGVVRRFLWM